MIVIPSFGLESESMIASFNKFVLSKASSNPSNVIACFLTIWVIKSLAKGAISGSVAIRYTTDIANPDFSKDSIRLSKTLLSLFLMILAALSRFLKDALIFARRLARYPEDGDDGDDASDDVVVDVAVVEVAFVELVDDAFADDLFKLEVEAPLVEPVDPFFKPTADKTGFKTDKSPELLEVSIPRLSNAELRLELKPEYLLYVRTMGLNADVNAPVSNELLEGVVVAPVLKPLTILNNPGKKVESCNTLRTISTESPDSSTE